MSKKVSEQIICDYCHTANISIAHDDQWDTKGILTFPEGDFHTSCHNKFLKEKADKAFWAENGNAIIGYSALYKIPIHANDNFQTGIDGEFKNKLFVSRDEGLDYLYVLSNPNAKRSDYPSEIRKRNFEHDRKEQAIRSKESEILRRLAMNELKMETETEQSTKDDKDKSSD